MDRTFAFRLVQLVAGLFLSSIVHAAADSFSVNSLAGIARVEIEVTGIHRDFARYGLDGDELRRRVATRLAAHGLPVVSDVAVGTDAQTGQLEIKLITNKDQYAFYHYAISVTLKRRIPIDAGSAAYGSIAAWSEGRHGILNPSDLHAVYGYVDTLLSRFITAYANDNAARPASGS
jgi:hypothetical protein